jgi:hypothetical protein
VEVIRFEEVQVLSLKVYEELDLFGDIAQVLAVQTEVVVQGPQRRMEPGRSEEVVVDSLAARKVVVDIVVLFKLGPKFFIHNSITNLVSDWECSIFGGLAATVQLGVDSLHHSLVDVHIGRKVGLVSSMHQEDSHSHGRT